MAYRRVHPEVGNMLGVFGLVMGPKMHESGDSAFALFVVSRLLGVKVEKAAVAGIGGGAEPPRAISGICHAGIAVYGSVWVDLHAPKDQAASWLGAMQALRIALLRLRRRLRAHARNPDIAQASSLVGLVVGYTVAGRDPDLLCAEESFPERVLQHCFLRLLGGLGDGLLREPGLVCGNICLPRVRCLGVHRQRRFGTPIRISGAALLRVGPVRKLRGPSGVGRRQRS